MELKHQNRLLWYRAVSKRHSWLCSGVTCAPITSPHLLIELQGAWPAQNTAIQSRFGPMGRNLGGELRTRYNFLESMAFCFPPSVVSHSSRTCVSQWLHNPKFATSQFQNLAGACTSCICCSTCIVSYTVIKDSRVPSINSWVVDLFSSVLALIY